jgi:hypothetical protein
MLKPFIYIFISLLLFSCGKTADEKTASAILSANIYLGKGDCQPAIDILEANGRQNLNARYLKVLSSAYACRAGFSVVTFFTSDLGLTATPPPLGGASIYSTSLVTSTSPLQSDFDFRDLQIAIDILLYAGGIPSTEEPTSHERTRYFTASEAADIDSQLLFMMFAQLGKYMHVYGNGNAAGLKGAGLAANKCFTGYNLAYTDGGSNAAIRAVIDALPAGCQGATGSPHLELKTTLVADATRKTRLCQGVVILNGIFNVLPSVVASATGNLATQTAAVTAAAGAATLALNTADPAIGTVASTINQSVCEDNTSVPVAKIETYFAFMHESIFQD